MQICDKQQTYMPYMVLIKIYFAFKFFSRAQAHYPKLLQIYLLPRHKRLECLVRVMFLPANLRF